TADCTLTWSARSSSPPKVGRLLAVVAGARSRVEAQPEDAVLTAPSPGPALGPDETRRFREAVLVHADAAYNLALRLARRPDVAEDLVQDAFVRALAAFGGYRGGDGR